MKSGDRLALIKRMLGARKFQLEQLVIYEADKHVIDMLHNGAEKSTLVKLSFALFRQEQKHQLSPDLDNLRKFTNI